MVNNIHHKMMKKLSHRKNYRKEEYLPVKLIKKLQEDIFSDSGYEYRSKNNFSSVCVNNTLSSTY